LGGEPHKTWLYEESSITDFFRAEWFGGDDKQENERKRCFWPQWLVEKKHDLAVYLIHYPADKMGWNTGWSLETQAAGVGAVIMSYPEVRKSDAPIVFICHSLGGLVAKQSILGAYTDFQDRVVGIVFFATPHDGSNLATIASACGLAVTDTMRELIANSPKLEKLSDDYRNFVANNGDRIRHLVFYETEGVGKFVKVVTSGSANPGLARALRIPIGRNHIDICKLRDPEDPVFHQVTAFLEDALEPRSATTREMFQALRDDISRLRDMIQSDIARREAKAVKEALEDHSRSGAARAIVGTVTDGEDEIGPLIQFEDSSRER
jgi:hypothetical protein